MNKNNVDDNDYPMINSSLISDCCGAPSLGEISDDCDGIILGTCSKCLCNTIFQEDIEDERKY